ncbi:unnamed protein product [Adineta steineri]|uniref:Uncharacterized protein n=1 Tax=Adineta steineri TaxID=433720 RepID=A0A813P0C2_9BILA|nr:unnamed protein product [Adineta steineri]CAF0774733.1 unnamed protein product [Adineta steineri]CAF3531151.1 unnamed protein product [Adineta steineri]CAF3557101.1 unnamed protein product [Adineta steineri]
MLNVSDSAMSKSISISNIRLYQFIREKCKAAVVEQKRIDGNSLIFDQPKEKWMVMIVKHPFLRNLLIEDIDFKKSGKEKENECKEKKKRLDEDSVKKCPKCEQNYIPSKTNHGNCHYHDGYVYDISNKCKLTNEEAQIKVQKMKLLANSTPGSQSAQVAKLMWACCLGLYGIDPPCQVGSCGLPEELKQHANDSAEEQMKHVRDRFMNNKAAEKRIKDFVAQI